MDGGGVPLASLLVWLALLAALAAYTARVRAERRGGHAWPAARTLAFTAGLALLALAAAPPLVGLAHHDLRAHMLQHLLTGMLAPLALVLGHPGTLMLRRLPTHWARAVDRLMPLRWWGWPPALLLLALVLDLGGLFALYLTPLYARLGAHPALHALVQAHVLAAGLLLTWGVVGVEASPLRAAFPLRVGALGVAMAAHATLAKVMYAGLYPRGTGDAPAQVQQAATLMYYGGDVAELLLALLVFWRWLARRARAPQTAALT